MTKSIFFTVAGTALLSVSLTSFAASPAADLAQEKEVVCAAHTQGADRRLAVTMSLATVVFFVPISTSGAPLRPGPC